MADRNITAQFQAQEARFLSAAARAVNNRPDVDPAIAKEIAVAYTGADKALKQEMLRHDVPTAEGAPADRSWLKREARAIQSQHYNTIHSNILKKYGPAGETAMQAVNDELNPPGLVDGITKQFYDKGSFKMGGLLGAGAGALAAYSIAGGFGGGPLGIITMVAMAIGGALGGNMLTEYVASASHTPKPTSLPASTSPAPEREESPSIDDKSILVNQEMSPAARAKAALNPLPAGTTVEKVVTDEFTNGFSPSAFPQKPKQTAPKLPGNDGQSI